MKTKSNFLMGMGCILLMSACNPAIKQDLVKENFKFAAKQLQYALLQVEEVRASEPKKSQGNNKKGLGELTNPRSLRPDGSLELVPSKDWTSGFFPGELWYMYEYTHDTFWEDQARKHTEMLEQEKTNGRTHDMGFKMYCSYGNGYRLTGDSLYRDVLLQSAQTLITRYKPLIGCIRSWDHQPQKWQFPVIIDNMMNLELLFWAFRETKDSTYQHIAVRHAQTTLKNHFRPDYSSYHVVDYDTISGAPRIHMTHQGYADESAWSRGQAWGLYGYTMCYRETGRIEFLQQAQRIEEYIFTQPTLPKDFIPYWDFQAPNIPNEPRDASAAACIASALYELSCYVPEKSAIYRQQADHILLQLTENYRAGQQEAKGFLLLHSTGSKPHESEIDVPLVYADYYFLEALLRKAKLEKKESLF